MDPITPNLPSTGPTDPPEQPAAVGSQSSTAEPTPSPATPQLPSWASSPAPQPITPPQPELTAQASPADQSSLSTTAPLEQASLSGPFTGSMPVADQPLYKTNPKARRRLFMLVSGTALLLLVAAGVVFGLVLPNQPSAVWNTGLNRSAKALNELINTAAEKTTLDAYKKSQVTASVTGTVEGISFSGDFDSKFDMTSANGGLNIVAKQAGQPDKTYAVKAIGQLPKGQTYPNVYLQLTGIKNLGLDSFIQGLSNYDGKWIAFDQSFYQGLNVDPATTNQQVTSDDIAEAAKAATSITTGYVFSTDSKKAVFERRKSVGKETVDGISAYHYVVGINKTNFGSYCDALIDKLTTVAAYKKLSGSDKDISADAKTSAKKDCRSSVEGVKDTDTFDLWVDAKYKLIYKVRFVNKTSKGSYIDVGQKYKGGDEIALFVHANDPKTRVDTNFTLTSNIKKNSTKAEFTIVNTSSESPYNAKITVEAKPYSGTIDSTSPAGAIKIQDVLNALGLGQALGANSSL